MPADGHKVGPQAFGRKGKFQKPLHGVGVQQGVGLVPFEYLRGLGHGLDGSRLVVHQQHGHQHRVRPQGLFQGFDADMPRGVRVQIGHLISLHLQRLARLQHGGVLHGGGDDVLPLVPPQMNRQLHRPVVPLGPAGGKIQLLRPAAQRLRHRRPVLRHRLGRLGPQGIQGGGVAIRHRHGLHRRLRRLRQDPCGGRVVKIDHIHKRPLFTQKSCLIVMTQGEKVKGGGKRGIERTQVRTITCTHLLRV